MATSLVVNPTNAPPRPGQALPFLTEKRVKLLTEGNGKKKDPFNDGKDYQDEGAPLLTSTAGLFVDEEQQRKNRKPAVAVTQGLIAAPTPEEMKALANPDEVSQGTHIRQLREAIVMDVDAKLITSTTQQMKNGVFREAHYPSLNEFVNSQYYRKLRETQVHLSLMTKQGNKTRFRESTTVRGIRFNPVLVHKFRAVDNSILKRFRESDKKRLKEQGFPGDFGDFGSIGISGIGQLGQTFDGGQVTGLAGREPDFIPLISGPYNKQLYWFDYLDMHSKAFEAWTHNPIAKRIVKVITQFCLGKGVKVTVMQAEQKTGQVQQNPTTGQPVPVYNDFREQAQAKLDQHWMKNGMHIRSKQILQDLLVMGEQFIRYYDAPWGLRIRSIDPSTVWEVVTDPDDCENEFYIHQQYPTRYQWYVDLPVPTIKFIIRQVPAMNYYHMKINCTSTEVRGRSELFAVLGWLKRLKEFATDRVIRNKMANLFVLDVAVEGDQAAVNTVQAQFNTPPTPGSFFIHNKAAELQGIKAEVGAGDVNQDWEMLLTMTGAGAGLSLQYLGLSAGGSKAEALVGTEPDIKTFEDYQELMEQFYLQDSQRCFARCQERGELPKNLNLKVEVTFPALAEENRSEKLKDLAFGESMSWWSHRRIASAASKEMQFTSYDYDEEQEDVAMEDAQKEVLINTAYQQVTKGVDNSKSATGGGGTSSGASGKGASGMGMGRLPGASSGGSKQSGTESERESVHRISASRRVSSSSELSLPATSPGTSTATGVSGFATTHNASIGDKKNPWAGRDPRDVAESIKREAANLRYERRGIGRRERIQSPDQVRDQKSMDRGDIITKAKRAAKRGHLNKEADSDVSPEKHDPPAMAPDYGAISAPYYKQRNIVVGEARRGRDGIIRHPRRFAKEGGPGSGPHEGYKGEMKVSRKGNARKDTRELRTLRHLSSLTPEGRKEYLSTVAKMAGVDSDHYKSIKKLADRIEAGDFKESMSPFKTQDGDKLSRTKSRNYPTEKNSHDLRTGRPNNPRGFGDNKRERF